MPVAIETDKNLIVVALQAAGLTVFPINPRAVARYRERHGQSGKKSDPGDAALLADVLRTDRHQHRPLPAISDGGRAVKALARQHQEAIWALHQTTSRLRSVLLEFYPQALQAFPNLKHKAALAVLAAARTPELGARLTSPQGRGAAARCGRRNDPALVEQILPDFKAPALRQPAAVEAALGTTVLGLLAHHHRDAHRGRAARGGTGRRVRRAPARAGLAVSAWPRPGPGSPSPGRGRRRPSRFTTAGACAPSPAPLPSPAPRAARRLRQRPPSPQQAARRRLPLVGLRHAHQVPGRPRPLRPPPRRRRPSQRRPAQPGEQAPRPALVVPAQQPDLGRRTPPGTSPTPRPPSSLLDT